jgi:polar amino acid transport system substrate-binding protein
MKTLFLFLLLLGMIPCAHAQDTAKWVFTNYPPANYRLPNGQYAGYLHDIVIDAFEKRLGIKVHIEVMPWKRCQGMVADGTADLMVTIPTAQRLTYAVTHDKPIWIKRRILFTYRGHPRFDAINRLNGLAEIKAGGYTVISYLGNDWVKSSLQHTGIPILYATTVDGMYRMLSAQRGDLVVEQRGLARSQIQALGLAETVVETGGVASESGFHILISKKSPCASLIPRLNREIEAMRASGDLDRIISHYGADAN